MRTASWPSTLRHCILLATNPSPLDALARDLIEGLEEAEGKVAVSCGSTMVPGQNRSPGLRDVFLATDFPLPGRSPAMNFARLAEDRWGTQAGRIPKGITIPAQESHSGAFPDVPEIEGPEIGAV